MFFTFMHLGDTFIQSDLQSFIREPTIVLVHIARFIKQLD